MTKKEIKIGEIKGAEYGYKSPLLVTLEITLKQLKGVYRDTELSFVKDPYVLRIVGNIWNPTRTDIVTGGQIVDEIYHAIKSKRFTSFYIPEDKLMKLLKIWKDYHLNDTMPGTERQMALVKGIPLLKRVDILSEHKLYIDRGFEYGSDWLVRRIPDEVVEFIKNIIDVGR